VNIFRILRRRKIRLSFVLIVLICFIVNTYAWVSNAKDVEGGAFIANVSYWGIQMMVDGEEKDELYTYEIDEFYPGIETISKRITVHNVGDENANLKVNIEEIYFCGKNILKIANEDGIELPETLSVISEDEETGVKSVDAFGNPDATIFDPDNINYGFYLRYPTPFSITCTQDKNFLPGLVYIEDSTANIDLEFQWENNEENNEEDTKLGNMVYDYKQANPDEPALKIVVHVEVTPTDSGTTTLAELSNNNIADYIDLGNNIVGTEKTSDDWRIFYVDDETGTVYAILADYLPNSTGYAEAAGLDISDEYLVGASESDELLNAFNHETAWNSLANGISGATVTGTTSADLLIKSYNAKNGTSLLLTSSLTLDSSTKDFDLYMPRDTGYVCNIWLAAEDLMLMQPGGWMILWSWTSIGECAVLPVVALPSSTTVQLDETGLWTVVK